MGTPPRRRLPAPRPDQLREPVDRAEYTLQFTVTAIDGAVCGNPCRTLRLPDGLVHAASDDSGCVCQELETVHRPSWGGNYERGTRLQRPYTLHSSPSCMYLIHVIYEPPFFLSFFLPLSLSFCLSLSLSLPHSAFRASLCLVPARFPGKVMRTRIVTPY